MSAALEWGLRGEIHELLTYITRQRYCPSPIHG